MKSHEFARKLLDGPDLEIVTPRVQSYAYDSEPNMCAPIARIALTEPTASKLDAEDFDRCPMEVVLLSHRSEDRDEKEDVEDATEGGELLNDLMRDYSHPWPNEDAATRKYRKRTRDRIERALSTAAATADKLRENNEELREAFSRVKTEMERQAKLVAIYKLREAKYKSDLSSVIRAEMKHIEARLVEFYQLEKD